MGVYIKGMEMPDRCFACPMCEVYDAEVNCAISHGSYKEYRDVDEQTAINGRPDWCPLVPVPPHGDLIDRDAMYKAINDARKEDPLLADVYVDDYVIVSDWLRHAPTIIPASEEGET